MHIAKFPMYIHPYAPFYSVKAKQNTAFQMTEITFITTTETTLQEEKDTYTKATMKFVFFLCKKTV